MCSERLRRAAVAARVLQRVHVDDDPVIAREPHVLVLPQSDRLEKALAALRSAGDDEAAARAGFAQRGAVRRRRARASTMPMAQRRPGSSSRLAMCASSIRRNASTGGDVRRPYGRASRSWAATAYPLLATAVRRFGGSQTVHPAIHNANHASKSLYAAAACHLWMCERRVMKGVRALCR